MFKRAFDVAAALIGLVLLSPGFLIVSLLIKLDSAGPVFYRAKRVGHRGQIFTMYKFRTMVTDADRRGPAVTYGQDPRITRVGRWLRNARLDEFPQLWNVLTGDMSFVGPRPESIYYYERYTEQQKQIFQVKPGMTGITQIVFRHEEDLLTNPATIDRDYLEEVLPPKVELDLDYIKNQSFWTDVSLIFQTLGVLAKDRVVKAPLPEVTSAKGAD
jgi:lipopolysaccharide/colanic/teichoic acid biosynthesis glycosyltransferase